MVSQSLVEEWQYWTNAQSPQKFMDISRISGWETIGRAVDGYMVKIQDIRPEWADLNAEELEEIRNMLMSYLFLTRNVEWT